jgi:transcriptional regulator with XRE-family HTH domain
VTAVNRTSPLQEATLQARWTLRRLARELRLARIASGKTQAHVGRALGISKSQISRRERGETAGLAYVELARQAAVVGLKLSGRLYPSARRPLDGPQLELLRRFRERIGPAWDWQMEVPMPEPGDLRAIDAVIRSPAGSAAVEAITRFADVQAQYRAGRLKQRDLGLDRLILVVAGTSANRAAIAAAGDHLETYVPVRTREALRELARVRPPRADALVLL